MDALGLKYFKSDIAGRYQKGIVKYRERLFAFLKHDGIPWNNNNAEHAVKYFAKYRRLTNGRIAEGGLHDYLVLLSLHQTCKYKEIRFLDFLLSRDRDIDHFANCATWRSLRICFLEIMWRQMVSGGFGAGLCLFQVSNVRACSYSGPVGSDMPELNLS